MPRLGRRHKLISALTTGAWPAYRASRLRLVVHRVMQIGPITPNTPSGTNWADESSQFNFNPQSVFNPLRSPGGLIVVPQGMGHDDFSKIYKNYIVVGAKLRVQVVGSQNVVDAGLGTPGSFQPFYIGCRCTTSASSSTASRETFGGDLEQILQQGAIKGQPAQLKLVGTSNMRNHTVFIGTTYSPRKCFNIPKKDALASGVGGDLISMTGRSPTPTTDHNAGWNLYIAQVPGADATSIVQAVLVKITITQLVIWSNRSQQEKSYTNPTPPP